MTGLLVSNRVTYVTLCGGILTKNLTIFADQTTDNDLLTTTIENSINCNDILTGQTTDTYILTIIIDNSVISITY